MASMPRGGVPPLRKGSMPQGSCLAALLLQEAFLGSQQSCPPGHQKSPCQAGLGAGLGGLRAPGQVPDPPLPTPGATLQGDGDPVSIRGPGCGARTHVGAGLSCLSGPTGFPSGCRTEG